MSRKPSSISPEPSSGAGSDGTTTPDAALVATAHALADRGLFGFVWLALDLTVVESFGELVRNVAQGCSVGEAILPLFGCEDEIRAVRDRPDTWLELPNLSTPTEGTIPGRFNISVHWIEARQLYLVHIRHVPARSRIAIELHQQARLRQIAEEQLQEKTRELEATNSELTRANKELDQFAYVLSHDLKAPLRALRQLSQDLGPALAARDPGTVEAITQGIRRQSQRMAAMMEGLYDYARVGRASLVEAAVDSRAIAQAVICSLPVPAGFHVSIEGTWPLLCTCAAPFDLVLRNLVDNALKHHDRPRGRVNLTAEDAGASLIVRIADDGPGIAEHQRRAIFEPFVQLADEPPPESSGIGLALVKKVIDAMGGSIAIEAPPPPMRGSTFVVSWPKR